MTIDEANLELDKIIRERFETVHLKAKVTPYTNTVVIRIDGEFSSKFLTRIAKIAEAIENE